MVLNGVSVMKNETVSECRKLAENNTKLNTIEEEESNIRNYANDERLTM